MQSKPGSVMPLVMLCIWVMDQTIFGFLKLPYVKVLFLGLPFCKILGFIAFLTAVFYHITLSICSRSCPLKTLIADGAKCIEARKFIQQRTSKQNMLERRKIIVCRKVAAPPTSSSCTAALFPSPSIIVTKTEAGLKLKIVQVSNFIWQQQTIKLRDLWVKVWCCALVHDYDFQRWSFSSHLLRAQVSPVGSTSEVASIPRPSGSHLETNITGGTQGSA